MKLGTRPRYSLRMMIELARLSDGDQPVAMQDISAWAAISRRYLDQLVVPLKSAGLVKAHAGRNGGYTLARPAAEISLREILQAAGMAVELAECVDSPQACVRSDACQCRLLWALLTLRIRDVLDEYSLADMVDPEWLLGHLAKEKSRLATRTSGKAHRTVPRLDGAVPAAPAPGKAERKPRRRMPRGPKETL